MVRELAFHKVAWVRFRCRCFLWIQFVVSLFYSKRFFSLVLRISSLTKKKKKKIYIYIYIDLIPCNLVNLESPQVVEQLCSAAFTETEMRLFFIVTINILISIISSNIIRCCLTCKNFVCTIAYFFRHHGYQ